MAIGLPGALVHLDQQTGGDATDLNEDKLNGMGAEWSRFTSSLRSGVGTADARVAHGMADQSGAAVLASHTTWGAQNAPKQSLAAGAVGGDIVGVGHRIMALFAVAKKTFDIVALIQLAIQIAQAIAEAIPTWGASLALIPILKLITTKLRTRATTMAITRLSAA